MLRLHDNASSGNAYKERLLLAHLGSPCQRLEYWLARVASQAGHVLITKDALTR